MRLDYIQKVLNNFFEKELEIYASNIELERAHRMKKPKFQAEGAGQTIPD